VADHFGITFEPRLQINTMLSEAEEARVIGLGTGGHAWVGHNDQVMAAIAELPVTGERPGSR
jgi:hypothetical protein